MIFDVYDLATGHRSLCCLFKRMPSYDEYIPQLLLVSNRRRLLLPLWCMNCERRISASSLLDVSSTFSFQWIFFLDLNDMNMNKINDMVFRAEKKTLHLRTPFSFPFYSFWYEQRFFLYFFCYQMNMTEFVCLLKQWTIHGNHSNILWTIDGTYFVRCTCTCHIPYTIACYTPFRFISMKWNNHSGMKVLNSQISLLLLSIV